MYFVLPNLPINQSALYLLLTYQYYSTTTVACTIPSIVCSGSIYILVARQELDAK